MGNRLKRLYQKKDSKKLAAIGISVIFTVILSALLIDSSAINKDVSGKSSLTAADYQENNIADYVKISEPVKEFVEISETVSVSKTVTFTDKLAKSKTSYWGIDVAKWQGVIDWEKVKKAGVEFAFIRVGYRTQKTGVICEDPYAEYNLQQAQLNGIKIGVYFFSSAVNKKEAKEEAAWVADFIAQYPITYPVVYNCEGFSDEENRQYGLDKEDRTGLAVSFLNAIKKKGYTPMFYAGKNELENNAEWNTKVLSSKYKIWVAQYTDKKYSKKLKSAYTGKHAIWQYTNKGNIEGIDKPVDINIAYFGYKKTAKPKDSTPWEAVMADPAALINFTEVEEIVTAKEVTNLRSEPSTANPDTVVVVLKNGETVQRTGIGDNGWSRIEYQGQTLYAVSNYLMLAEDLECNLIANE